jgi:hypothetical protein
MKELQAETSTWPCRGLEALCTSDVAGTPLDALPPFLEARVVTTLAKNERSALALKTTSGWFTDLVVLDESERCVLGDVGTTSGKVVSIEAEDKEKEVHVVVETRSSAPSYLTDPDGSPYIQVDTTAERWLHVCRIDAGEPACKKTRRVAHWEGTNEPPPDVSKWTPN